MSQREGTVQGHSLHPGGVNVESGIESEIGGVHQEQWDGHPSCLLCLPLSSTTG
jgi:hypothetical protein